MPYLTVGDGTRLFFQLEGGNPELPVLIFSHSLGTDQSMWDAQAATLAPYFRVLRYDMRGHGASAVPPGEYTIERLGQDAIEIADQFGVDKFAFCGISIGGMIGQWIALNAPERLTHLVLANSSPFVPPPETWDERRKAVLERGMASICDAMMARYFSPATLLRNEAPVSRLRFNLMGMHPNGYAACCSAIRDLDFRGRLSEIHTPTLVIGGDQDPSLPWAGNAEILARDIPDAKTRKIAAYHLSNVDRPGAFNAALAAFLLPPPEDGSVLAAGYEVRREVMGKAFVDAVLASNTDFTREFDEWITRYAWAAVWRRPGLDHRTRRLLTLAVTAALGRWDQYRSHLSAALEDGLEASDIHEMLLQLGIYAGVPAANTGFSIAREELDRMGY